MSVPKRTKTLGQPIFAFVVGEILSIGLTIVGVNLSQHKLYVNEQTVTA